MQTQRWPAKLLRGFYDMVRVGARLESARQKMIKPSLIFKHTLTTSRARKSLALTAWPASRNADAEIKPPRILPPQFTWPAHRDPHLCLLSCGQ